VGIIAFSDIGNILLLHTTGNTDYDSASRRPAGLSTSFHTGALIPFPFLIRPLRLLFTFLESHEGVEENMNLFIS
jgi:hypothetical protein